jgi:hypothetical protein
MDTPAERICSSSSCKARLPPKCIYSDARALFYSLRLRKKENEEISFSGTYEMDVDPIVNDSKYIRMNAVETRKCQITVSREIVILCIYLLIIS